MILGRYLGPATDIGSALTAKVLQPNGQFVCRSTLQHLTDKELQSSDHLDKQRQFNEPVATHLGPASTVQDFPAENLTPDPDHFDDSDPNDPDYGDTARSCFPVAEQWSKDTFRVQV